jgi:hypothetical protein
VELLLLELPAAQLNFLCLILQMLLQQHFANAIDTQSKGIDVSHKATIGNG